jgi:hypothetical protein
MGMDILRSVHLKSSWGYMTMADDIIRELWTIKDAIAAEYGCDVKALVAHLRSKTRDGILGEQGIVCEPIDEVWDHEHKGITHVRDRRGS